MEKHTGGGQTNAWGQRNAQGGTEKCTGRRYRETHRDGQRNTHISKLATETRKKHSNMYIDEYKIKQAGLSWGSVQAETVRLQMLR